MSGQEARNFWELMQQPVHAGSSEAPRCQEGLSVESQGAGTSRGCRPALAATSLDDICARGNASEELNGVFELLLAHDGLELA